MRLHALFGLAFAPATPRGLTSPHIVTRGLIMQKAPGHAVKDLALPELVGTRFQVLFHSPCRGAFHLSLTVLVRYRSPSSI